MKAQRLGTCLLGDHVFLRRQNSIGLHVRLHRSGPWMQGTGHIEMWLQEVFFVVVDALLCRGSLR